MPKHLGIVGVSAEGAALCYRTVCVEGAELFGRHGHPEVTLHTYSLADYMRHIDADDWHAVGDMVLASVAHLQRSGAELVICPDNTVHQAIDLVRDRSPLPWLHIAPQAIYWVTRHLQSLYGVKSFVITENGVGYEDQPDTRGEILDLHRREYLRNYLLAVQRATVERIPVHGYFAWSFIDNFEWAYGYAKRFGLVYNDYATQRRTPKLSAQWYAAVARENRVL